MHLLPTGGLSRWRLSSIHWLKSSGAGIMDAPCLRERNRPDGGPGPRQAGKGGRRARPRRWSLRSACGPSAVRPVDLDARQRRRVLVGQRLLAVDVEPEVMHAPVAQGVDPAIDVELLPGCPG